MKPILTMVKWHYSHMNPTSWGFILYLRYIHVINFWNSLWRVWEVDKFFRKILPGNTVFPGHCNVFIGLLCSFGLYVASFSPDVFHQACFCSGYHLIDDHYFDRFLRWSLWRGYTCFDNVCTLYVFSEMKASCDNENPQIYFFILSIALQGVP